jgi:2-polyprenyl-3-methyl-5-hydroxy-6-metoxy-1,4-benzoquinol methylase
MSRHTANHPCPVCTSEPTTAPDISGHPMLRCQKCSLVYAAAREVPAGFYDAAYSADGDYSEHLTVARGHLAGTRNFEWSNRWVFERVQPFGRRRSLDLGCGVGSALHLAKQSGWLPHGQDISQNALRVAREVFDAKTFSESIDQMAAQGEKFELITAFNLIEHLPQPLAYLKTVRQLMTPDGYLGIVVPNYDSYAMRNTHLAEWLPPFHLNFFNRQSLEHTLALAGLEVIAHKTQIASWRGIEGPKYKRYLLLPYLLANGVIGRLRGNLVVVLARIAK